MPDNKYPLVEYDYVTPLLKYLPPADTPDFSEPSKPVRRRPKALSKQPLDEFRQGIAGTNSKQRHFGKLLKAIAEVNSKNRKYATDSSIAGRLRQRPEYSHLSERQLRRDVSEAIKWVIDELKIVSPGRWAKIFGIKPPPAMTDAFRRKKAFEFLRHHLAKQLLAKKP